MHARGIYNARNYNHNPDLGQKRAQFSFILREYRRPGYNRGIYHLICHPLTKGNTYCDLARVVNLLLK